jgi:transcriptional regulator
MFVPGQYREPDGSWAVDLVRSNPLALLVTNGHDGDVPYATHLPIIFDPQTTGERPADLSRMTLLGHMNRANPHWKALVDDTLVLAIFTGAHAYVSPTVYAVTPAAPTWNFTSVHVHGVLRKISSSEETLETVQSTVRDFEAQFGADWDMSSSVDYFHRLLPGVGAFRIEVSRVQSMFKLSQEQQPQIRERVQQCFAQSESSRHRDVAGLMRRLPQANGAGTLPVP